MPEGKGCRGDWIRRRNGFGDNNGICSVPLMDCEFRSAARAHSVLCNGQDPARESSESLHFRKEGLLSHKRHQMLKRKPVTNKANKNEEGTHWRWKASVEPTAANQERTGKQDFTELPS